MSANVGSVAPDFTLPSVGGLARAQVSSITLSAYQGKSNVLLAFYPGDFTPVCTSEMRCFSQDWSQFRELGCEILGVSPDPIEKHQEFSKQLRLDFPLLSDPDKKVIQLYGVEGLLGPQRAYFIIDMQGLIRYKHVEWLPIFKREDSELLKAVRQINKES